MSVNLKSLKRNDMVRLRSGTEYYFISSERYPHYGYEDDVKLILRERWGHAHCGLVYDNEGSCRHYDRDHDIIEIIPEITWEGIKEMIQYEMRKALEELRK